MLRGAARLAQVLLLPARINTTLAAAKATNNLQGNHAMSTVSLPSATVVIVDSNPADYDALLSAAESSGLNVHFLSSGHDALYFARRWQAGLWLINTCLSDMSGFDVAQRLRRIESSAGSSSSARSTRWTTSCRH